MLQFLLSVLLIIESLSESPTEKLGAFFSNARNEVIERNKNYKKTKPSKPDKEHILFKPKKYKMNMQDSVETRWGPLCDEYTANYTVIYNYLNDLIESSGATDIIYNAAMEWFNKHVSEPYKSEIEYFANCTEVPLQGVVIVNLMEIFLLWGCTGIVCADSNNAIIFGRNFDLWLLDIQDELRSLLIDIEYRSGKDRLFEGNSFFGYSGIVAGVKKDGFAIAANSRYTDASILDCLSVLTNDGYVPYSWLIRDTLGNCDNYEAALTQLKSTPIATPCYYIIGGTEYPEGAVISRNFTDSINPFELETSDLDWFIIQTNSDWWKEEALTDERRADGIHNMKEMGRNHANERNLRLDVLSQFATINFGTICQTTMVPSGTGKSVYKSLVVQYEPAEDIDIETNNARFGPFTLNDDTDGRSFVDSFKAIWNQHFGFGMAIFAASAFLNILMCVYWSVSCKKDSGNNDAKVTQIIVNESESGMETDNAEFLIS